jgi:Tol biopolymer transport system component
MSRSIFVAVLVAGLLAAVPSAAQVGSGKIAFTDGIGNLFAITPGEPGPTLLGTTGRQVSPPRWSPGGSHIAFVEYFSATHGELRVMKHDGTGEHVVAAGDITLGRQPWSPDGSRLAWGPFSAGDIYTASAAGGAVRRITTDGRQKEPPSWSPNAQRLVYASALADGSGWRIFTAADDGSPPVQLTGGQGSIIDRQPAWSPTGSSIAFVRQAAIYVVRSDGTELRSVVGTSGNQAGEPAWSPDGSKIAYTNAAHSGYSRYGQQARRSSSSTSTARVSRGSPGRRRASSSTALRPGRRTATCFSIGRAPSLARS